MSKSSNVATLMLGFTAVLLAGHAGQARAQACPFDESPGGKSPEVIQSQLIQLAAESCTGSPTGGDKAALVRQVFSDIKDGAESEPHNPIKHRDGIATALRRLASFAQERQQKGEDAAHWNIIEQEIRRSALAVDQHGGVNVAGKPIAADYAISSAWRTFTQGMGQRDLVVAGTKIQPFGGVACASGTSPCAAYDSRVDMFRVAGLMAQLQNQAQSPALGMALQIAKRELDRWKAYRADGQHQYFWELMANSALMARRHCTQKKDASGERVFIGFCEVPTSQLILGHVDAGLRWSRSAKSTSELKPVVLIETIGWYQWKWKSDAGPEAATMVDRMGVSLAAAYAKHDDGSRSRWSYGPMFHWEGYSLALTKARGERWGMMINIGLADRYFDRRSAWYDKLKELR